MAAIDKSIQKDLKIQEHFVHAPSSHHVDSEMAQTYL